MKDLTNIIPQAELNSVKSRKEYIKIAHKQDKRNKIFLQHSTIFNKVTGELKTVSYDKEWHLRQSYLYNTFRIDYLNQECISNGMIPIFVTLTLPSEYHPTSFFYNPTLTIRNGYHKLQEIFRVIYDGFRVGRKRVKGLKFIRVIEPHKSYVPHLHAVVYVSESYKGEFLKHINNVIKSNNLKQTDTKVLDTARYAVTYLLKYVDKTLRGSDEMRGWRLYHKIDRVLTMSNLNIGITREVFKRISKYVPFDEGNNLCYLSQILQKVSINRIQIDSKNNIVKSVTYGNQNSNILVVETIKKYNKINPVTYDYDIDDIVYEDDSSYKLVDLVIFDKDLNELYNKKDYLFTLNGEYCPPDSLNKGYLLQFEYDNYIYNE